MARTIAFFPAVDDDEEVFVIPAEDLVDPLPVAFQRGWVSYRRGDNNVVVHLNLARYDAIHERDY